MELDKAIKEHLELRRRNAQLEPALPLERYYAQVPTTDDRSSNRQPEAPSEETQEFSPGRPVAAEPGSHTDSSNLWDLPPLFDWGE